MKTRTREALDLVWEFLAFLLTAFTFLLVGLAVSPGGLAAALPQIAWGFGALLVGRAVVVYGLLGGVAVVLPDRHVLPVPWLHVLFWAGLRGAVAIALTLSLPADLPDRALLAGTAYGIVLLTLVTQGTTVSWVLRRTGVAAEARREADGA
jgi:CPA1 family monovalent cation:H+ antiporter